MIWCALEKNGAICATEPWEWFSGKWSLEPGCGARAFISETVCGCGGMVGVAGFPWNESGLPDLKGMLVVFIDWIQNIWVFLLFPIKWAPSSPCLLPLDLFSPSLLYLIKANSVLKPEAKTKQSYEGLQESLFLLLSSILNPEDCWHQLKKKYLKSFTAHVLPSPQAGAGWGWGRASFYMEGQPWQTVERLDQHNIIKHGSEKRAVGLWGVSQTGHQALVKFCVLHPTVHLSHPPCEHPPQCTPLQQMHLLQCTPLPVCTCPHVHTQPHVHLP